MSLETLGEVSYRYGRLDRIGLFSIHLLRKALDGLRRQLVLKILDFLARGVLRSADALAAPILERCGRLLVHNALARLNTSFAAAVVGRALLQRGQLVLHVVRVQRARAELIRAFLLRIHLI